MGEASRIVKATADPQKRHEQPQMPIYPVPLQPYNAHRLHQDLSPFPTCQRRADPFTTPKLIGPQQRHHVLPSVQQSQGAALYKAEDAQSVAGGVEFSWKDGRLSAQSSLYAHSNFVPCNIQLQYPIDSSNLSLPTADLNTGVPRARYCPVPIQYLQYQTQIAVVDGVGVNQHPSMFPCWYDQSQQSPSSSFQPSNWHSHATRGHPIGVSLVRHPHFHCNHWYQAFPFVHINQSALGTQPCNATMTSSEVGAPRLWVVGTPTYSMHALGFGSVTSPRVPLPSSLTANTISAAFSSPHGSCGLSTINSSALQCSAESAFDPLRQETQDGAHLQGTIRGDCMSVNQKPQAQPFFSDFVPREQQVGTRPNNGDHSKEHCLHSRHHCLEYGVSSSLGESRRAAVSCISNPSVMNCFQERAIKFSSFQPPALDPSDFKTEGWNDGSVSHNIQTSFGEPEVYRGSSQHLVVLSPALDAYTASSPGSLCTVANEEFVTSSLKSSRHGKDSKSPGFQKLPNDLSSIPSCGQDTLALAAEGRTTLQRQTGKGQWGISETRLLIKLVKTYGTRRWSLIATYMSNRSGKQCRERWVNHLQPNIKKECWTSEEEQLLVRAHSTFGNRWSAIAKMLPGRTDNSIKNHWHAALRKKGRHGLFRPSLLRDYIQRKTGATGETKFQDDLASPVRDAVVSPDAPGIAHRPDDLLSSHPLNLH